MDHKTIQDQLFTLHDGELTGAARRAVEDHLLDCAECRAIVAQWKHVAGVLFRAPTLSTSEIFVQRVMQRIAPAAPRRSYLPRWIRQGGWPVPAMGLAVMLFVMTRGPIQQTVSVESLLLSDGREPAALQRVLSGERSSAEDILGLLMEEVS